MTGSERAADAPLRLLSWPGMPAPEALQRVAARIGVALHVETIVANEELERRLDEGWDLICPSDYMVARLARQGRLQPLDDALLPGRAQLADWSRRPAYDPEERWSVPLAFGTVGVLYDRAAVGDPQDWLVLFDPPAGARVGMLAEPREVVAAALLAGGHDANTADDGALAAAAALLERQAPAVARFDSDDFTGPVRARQVAAHQAWSGPASLALREDPGLGYTVPREGAVAWVTTVAIDAGCARPALAHAAIEALLDPALARLNVERHGFATPNAAARALLEPALRDDPVLFPAAQTLARCTTLRDLDAA
ncbi:MAG TPA: spermidine/putrescine ABC transporter substrate-binding protein, partial [Conexibacter sp.]|nr:spermidine/putrescine ABC transporter substrate-binding protein [Conexibacter sp.]